MKACRSWMRHVLEKVKPVDAWAKASATANLLLFSGGTQWSRNAITPISVGGLPVWNLHSRLFGGFVICVHSYVANIVVRLADFIQQEAAMFPMIRARRDARSLSRKLRHSLAAPDEKWKVGTDEQTHPSLSMGDVRIVLMPRAVRLLDAIHVYSRDAEIWLPLLARLRLRAAARLRLIQNANEHWDEPDLKKTSTRRRRAKPAA
jgi:hypothetical protein